MLIRNAEWIVKKYIFIYFFHCSLYSLIFKVNPLFNSYLLVVKEHTWNCLGFILIYQARGLNFWISLWEFTTFALAQFAAKLLI